ncbi:MAG TPA: NAD-dependent epimerase/dehydratase family protein [Gemmatimonadales bacterium]|nr:NAD-dependent epimerase/dehydratase family protein [Gemmatimonadales bacterium]
MVTGGSGFLGGYFHSALLDAGHSITILDLIPPAWDPRGARVVVGDVRDPAAVREALRGADAILHLAAAHHDFGIARETYFSVNEDGARVLCAAAEERDVRSICFFSSVAVYGAAPEPRHEGADPRPVSPYGKSKLAGERVFQAWAQAGPGRRCLVIRPTVVFGPRNFANMYSLVRQVDSGFFFRVADGRNIKSLSYVENVVPAALYLWSRPAAAPFEVYNYVDKPDLETRSLLARIYHALGRRMPEWSIPEGIAVAASLPFDLAARLTGRNLAISSARIRKMCAQTKFEADKVRQAGFQPPVPLLEAIERTVRWYQREGRDSRGTSHLPPEILRASGRNGRTRGGDGDE